METLPGPNVVGISPDVRSVVVCNKCHTVVAEDKGREIDRALVFWAVCNHVNHPVSELTHGVGHEILTVIMSTMTVYDGLSFPKDVQKQ